VTTSSRGGGARKRRDEWCHLEAAGLTARRCDRAATRPDVAGTPARRSPAVLAKSAPSRHNEWSRRILRQPGNTPHAAAHFPSIRVVRARPARHHRLARRSADHDLIVARCEAPLPGGVIATTEQARIADHCHYPALSPGWSMTFSKASSRIRWPSGGRVKCQADSNGPTSLHEAAVGRCSLRASARFRPGVRWRTILGG
jgi:hypothetical protein